MNLKVDETDSPSINDNLFYVFEKIIVCNTGEHIVNDIINYL
jgi:hypothetical protein